MTYDREGSRNFVSRYRRPKGSPGGGLEVLVHLPFGKGNRTDQGELI